LQRSGRSGVSVEPTQSDAELEDEIVNTDWRNLWELSGISNPWMPMALVEKFTVSTYILG